MTDFDAIAVELKKIARLLALEQTRQLAKGEKAQLLNACGFSNKEIASLIGTSEGSIRAMLSQGRKRESNED